MKYSKSVWLPVVSIFFMLGLAGAAIAETKKEWEGQFASPSQLVIKNNVGHIEVMTTDTTKINIQLTLEGQKSGWFNRSKKNVADIEPQISEEDGTLTIKLQEDNVKGQWFISIPENLSSLNIDQGVGKVELKTGETHTEVSLGVGNAYWELSAAQVGEFKLNSRVGSTQVTGARQLEQSRQVVQSQSTGRGFGQALITGSVGVGDLTLRLEN